MSEIKKIGKFEDSIDLMKDIPYLGFEIVPEYYELTKERISKVQKYE